MTSLQFSKNLKTDFQRSPREIDLQELQWQWDQGPEDAHLWAREQMVTGHFFHYNGGDYDTAKRRSNLIDQMLGLRIYPIELTLRAQAKSQSPTGHAGTWGAVLHQGNQTWVGLDPQTLLTPYSEIYDILNFMELPAKSVVIDLGAGYGRVGPVMASLLPDGTFIGHEYVKERVMEGRRVFQLLGLSRAQLEQTDLSADDFQLPSAHAYFLYDFGKVEHIRKILNKLDSLAMNQSFYVIARGETTRKLIEYSYPLFKNIYPPIDQKRYSIYRV